MRKILLGGLLIVAFSATGFAATQNNPGPPNIILILADDMGVGDVSGLSPKGKIPTPHIDSLVRNGLAFTDGHTSSAVCTPSRYSLLTGRYNWRNARKKGVASGFSRSEIEPGRLTLAGMLRRAGYRTAIFGKWHLGLDWSSDKAIVPAFPKTYGRAGSRQQTPGADIDYTKPFGGGPIDHGFDTFFGIAASLDMPPYIWLRDDRADEVPTLLKAFHRRGPASEAFEAVDVLPRLGDETVAFINEHAGEAKEGQPFFVYVPLTSPHTPLVPSEDWQGKSAIKTEYADFTMQTDQMVGNVLKSLEDNELTENTMVIFTADNGYAPAAGFHAHVKKGHQPSHIYRGHKADLYEGGHRVPFIIQWPAGAEGGRTTGQLVVQTDFFRTFAELVGQDVADDAAEDSISFLSVLRGESDHGARTSHVAHSVSGKLSIRAREWKLIVDHGSGGWTPLGKRYRGQPGEPARRADLPPMGLFNIAEDPGEHDNLLMEHPEVARELIQRLRDVIARGRSTPGKPQRNNGKVGLEVPVKWSM